MTSRFGMQLIKATWIKALAGDLPIERKIENPILWLRDHHGFRYSFKPTTGIRGTQWGQFIAHSHIVETKGVNTSGGAVYGYVVSDIITGQRLGNSFRTIRAAKAAAKLYFETFGYIDFREHLGDPIFEERLKAFRLDLNPLYFD